MKLTLTWSQRIREALEEDKFVLYCQPIIDLHGRGGSRYELLLRMLGQGAEVIPPATFLTIAERSGLIGEIDRWVVTHAIELAADLERRGRRVSFEVNLSGKSVVDPELPELIERRLHETAVDPTSRSSTSRRRSGLRRSSAAWAASWL
jgi:EAL domain-containing protein (putative c-di-GMP-specific phosphodiesterase class I)